MGILYNFPWISMDMNGILEILASSKRLQITR